MGRSTVRKKRLCCVIPTNGDHPFVRVVDTLGRCRRQFATVENRPLIHRRSRYRPIHRSRSTVNEHVGLFSSVDNRIPFVREGDEGHHLSQNYISHPLENATHDAIRNYDDCHEARQGEKAARSAAFSLLPPHLSGWCIRFELLCGCCAFAGRRSKSTECDPHVAEAGRWRDTFSEAPRYVWTFPNASIEHCAG